MKILKFPLSKIFSGFVFGLMLCKPFAFDCLYVLLILSICLCGLLLLHYYTNRNRKLQPVFGVLVLFASVLTGIATALLHKDSLRSDHYLNQIWDYESPHRMELVVENKLKKTPKKSRYLCRVIELDGKKSFGKTILNIDKNCKLNTPKPGTHISVNGTLFRNKSPLNPSLFDYAAYLENQGIFAQVYCKTLKTGKHESGLLTAFANFREKIITNLERSHIPQEELNVLNALILGQQEDISQNTLRDYQYAGAVHVLSVSGLHVGFILLFLNFLLKPIGNSKKGALIKLTVVVCCLWAFAILAGLSPSIVRSATMFSFLAVGTHLRRSVNIYYTLLVSMLLILLFKPSFLYDVGFQLSYLALFFIVWLQPMFSDIWVPRNKVLRYFWDIITVSFAAQIGTMLLSIYYFHQFPCLFFVTNLIILPLLGVIMAVGVVAIVIAVFGLVPMWIAQLTGWLIGLLNLIIHQIALLDDFVIKDISFTREMMLVGYAVIVLFVLWYQKPIFRRLALALTGMLIFQSILIYNQIKVANQSELIVFHARNNTLITQRNGREVTLYFNYSIASTATNNLIIQSYLVGNFSRISRNMELRNLMWFKNQKILIIDSSGVYPKTIQPDVLLIIQSPKLNIERLLENMKPKVVVADGSDYRSYIRLWEASCRKKKIPFHNTNEKGFYKI